MHGAEYDELIAALDAYKDKFALVEVADNLKIKNDKYYKDLSINNKVKAENNNETIIPFWIICLRILTSFNINNVKKVQKLYYYQNIFFFN